jgi:hypothetical protein
MTFEAGLIMRQIPVAALLILVFNVIFTTPVRTEEPVTITRLVMRERVVTITSGQNGPRYSVFAKDGAVLAAALNEAQLAEQHPDVYEQVRPSVAGEATPSAAIWAGM